MSASPEDVFKAADKAWREKGGLTAKTAAYAGMDGAEKTAYKECLEKGTMNGQPAPVKRKLSEVFKTLQPLGCQYCQGEHCTMRCTHPEKDALRKALSAEVTSKWAAVADRKQGSRRSKVGTAPTARARRSSLTTSIATTAACSRSASSYRCALACLAHFSSHPCLPLQSVMSSPLHLAVPDSTVGPIGSARS